jgi:hypothetical protein
MDEKMRMDKIKEPERGRRKQLPEQITYAWYRLVNITWRNVALNQFCNAIAITLLIESS